MKDADNLLPFIELKERFDIKTNFLYHGVVSCLKLLANAMKWCVYCSLQSSKTIHWEMAYKPPFCSTKAIPN